MALDVSHIFTLLTADVPVAALERELVSLTRAAEEQDIRDATTASPARPTLSNHMLSLSSSEQAPPPTPSRSALSLALPATPSPSKSSSSLALPDNNLLAPLSPRKRRARTRGRSPKRTLDPSEPSPSPSSSSPPASSTPQRKKALTQGSQLFDQQVQRDGSGSSLTAPPLVLAERRANTRGATISAGDVLQFPPIVDYAKRNSKSSKSAKSSSPSTSSSSSSLADLLPESDMSRPIYTGSATNVDIFAAADSDGTGGAALLLPPAVSEAARHQLSSCRNGQGQSLLEAAYATRDLRKFQLLLSTLIDPFVCVSDGRPLLAVLAAASDFDTHSFALSLLIAVSAWYERAKKARPFGGVSLSSNDKAKQVARSQVAQRLAGIKQLDLSGVGLRAVPKAVWLLVELEFLDLSRNQLRSLSGSVQRLTKLAELDLSNCSELNCIPAALAELPRLTRLRLAGSPVSCVPESVQFQYVSSESSSLTAHHVKDYLRSLRSETRWKLVKLMVLGQEAVGKTTLVRAVSGANVGRLGPGGDTLSTTGVDVAEWKAKGTVFSVWDFGGQSVFYPTHQFFLTNRSVYLLVFDLSVPVSQSRLDYWLKKIQIMTTNDTPVLLVGTHADDPRLTKAHVAAVLDKVGKKCSRYAQVRLPVLAISCRDKRDVKNVRKTLERLVADNKSLQQRTPRGWALVPNEVAKLKKQAPYLSLPDFKETVFTACGVLKSETHSALRFFHESGVVVYFDDSHMELSKLVIIDPEWLSKVMASIITFEHSYASGHGLLERSHLRQIWAQYPRPLWPALLALLERFEVAYPWLRLDGPPCLIVPSLLPQAPPAHLPTVWPERCPVGYRQYGREYQFQFVPLGFYARLFMRLVRTPGVIVADGLSWVCGCVIRYGAHLALVESNDTDFRIRISVREHNSYAAPSSPRSSSLSSSSSSAAPGLERQPHKRSALAARYLLSNDADASPTSTPTPTAGDSSGEAAGSSDDAGLEPNLLRVVVETLEPLLEYSYPNLRDSTIRTLPCVHCLGSDDAQTRSQPFMFSLEECTAALDSGASYVHCCGLRTRPVLLSALAPDLSFSDMQVIDDDEYEVLGELGSGGFGTVYKARMRASDQLVAVKELNLDSVSASAAERLQKFNEFQREVHMMAALCNAYLVRLYGVSLLPRLRMVIEFVDGSDLYHLVHDASVTSEQYSWSVQLQIAYDVACGMEFLHGCNPPVAHADLRSPNVFLHIERSAAGRWQAVRAKVADFGLSRRVFSHTEGFLNTWQWMAPEVLDVSRDRFDERIDIYSYGIVLWEIVARAFPFEEYTEYMVKRVDAQGVEHAYLRERDIKNAIIANNLRPTPYGPDAYRQLMTDCWQTDPHSRPSFKEIKALLEPMFAAPPPPMPASPTVTLRHRRKQQPEQAPAAAAAAQHEDAPKPPTLEATLPLQFVAAASCLQSNHAYLWLADANAPRLDVFDVAARSSAHSVATGSQVTALASVDTHVWLGLANGTLLVHTSFAPGAATAALATLTPLAPVEAPVSALRWIVPQSAPADDSIWLCSEQGCRLAVINASTLACVALMVIEPGPSALVQHGDHVWLAASSTMQVFSAVTRQHLFQVAYSTGGNITALHADAQHLWSGCSDGTIAVWNQTGQFVRSLRSSSSAVAAVASFGPHLFAAGNEKNIVMVDCTEFKPLLELPPCANAVTALLPCRQSPQPPLLLCVAGNQLLLWRAHSADVHLAEAAPGPPRAYKNVAKSHADSAASSSSSSSSSATSTGQKIRKFFGRKS